MPVTSVKLIKVPQAKNECSLESLRSSTRRIKVKTVTGLVQSHALVCRLKNWNSISTSTPRQPWSSRRCLAEWESFLFLFTKVGVGTSLIAQMSRSPLLQTCKKELLLIEEWSSASLSKCTHPFRAAQVHHQDMVNTKYTSWLPSGLHRYFYPNSFWCICKGFPCSVFFWAIQWKL